MDTSKLFVGFFDHTRLDNEDKRKEWSETNASMHPTDTKGTIIHTKVTTKNRSTTQYQI